MFLSDSISARQAGCVPAAVYLLVSLALAIGLAPAVAAETAAVGEESASEAIWGRQDDGAELSDTVAVLAAGRGEPWIRLADARALETRYLGAAELEQALAAAEGRSLAAADLDEDGVPDLVCGYAAAGGGILALYRGNVDSIYPWSEEAMERKDAGTFTGAPFLSPARLVGLAAAPDFLATGDFDNDGHQDVLAAARFDRRLLLLPGDGRGGLGPVREIALSGAVTALAAGDVGRRDGLPEIVVAVTGAGAPSLLLLRSDRGAAAARPVAFELPAEARDLALGQLDERPDRDLAVAAGHEVLIVGGRWFGHRGPDPEAIRRVAFAAPVESLAAGNFLPATSALELAALGADGKVRILEPRSGALDGGPSFDATAGGPGEILQVRLSSVRGDEVLALDGGGGTLRIVIPAEPGDPGSETGLPADAGPLGAQLEVLATPAAVLPMRLNPDALSDVVVLHAGAMAPSVALTTAGVTFTVNDPGDDPDGDLYDGVCHTGNDTYPTGICTLRAAIEQTNYLPGADEIRFSVSRIRQPGSQWPWITDTISILGNAGGSRVELQGGRLPVGSASSLVRGLVINDSAYLDIRSDGGVIESCYAGTDRAGTTALDGGGLQVHYSDTVVGGTVAAARNVISGNWGNGLEVWDGERTTIQGNLVGTDSSGAVAMGNDEEGIHIQDNNDSTIGGVARGAGNVVAANPETGLLIGSNGTLVQGNWIGTDRSGEIDLGNGIPGGHGIFVWGDDNVIGGPPAGAGNVIAFNAYNGIKVWDDDGNLISRNSIYSNGDLGILLAQGGNNWQDYPVLEAVSWTPGSTLVSGVLDSLADTDFRIELFSSPECDPSGRGEGKTFLEAFDVTTGADGLASFEHQVDASAVVVTATATNLETNDTSEFSPCVKPPLTINAGPANGGGFVHQTAETQGIVVLHAVLSAGDQAVTVDAATFRAAGSGDDAADLAAVKLFADLDGDGAVDAGEPQIGGTRTFAADDGEVTFSALDRTIAAGESESWILTYDAGRSACPCETYRPSLEAADVVASGEPRGEVTGRGLEIRPGGITIAGGNDQSTMIGNDLAAPFAVQVADQYPECGGVDFEAFQAPVGASGQQFSNGETEITASLSAEGRAEAAFTLGSKKGDYQVKASPHSAEVAGCTAPPSEVTFTAGAVGLGLTDALMSYRPAENRIRTFITNIAAQNVFTVGLDPATAPGFTLQQVTFDLIGAPIVDTSAPFTATYDMQHVETADSLAVTAVVDVSGATQQVQLSYPVQAIDFPGWFSVIQGISTAFDASFNSDQRRYEITYRYPNNFVWSDTVDSAVALLGGLDNDVGEDNRLQVEAIATYDLDSRSSVSADTDWQGEILGIAVDLHGELRANFNPIFELIESTRPVGKVEADARYLLPERNFSRTFPVSGVPITVGLDLGGELRLILTGSIYFDSDMRFSRLEVVATPGVKMVITASAEAVFGAARIAATAEPDVSVRIQLPYTADGGVQAPTFNGRLVIELSLQGSLFWNLVNAELYSDTLGPFTWSSSDPRLAETRPTRAGEPPQFINTVAVASDGGDRAVMVFTADVGSGSPDPEIHFRLRSAGGDWGDEQALTSGNDRWELDPAVVYLSGDKALALWTSNRGDHALDDLDQIFAHQELAWSLWDGAAWSAAADLTADLAADGSADLAYTAAGGGQTIAVWLHDADGTNAATTRTDWEIYWALYDEAGGVWSVPATLSADGFASYMPAVAANSSGVAMAVWSEDEDGWFFQDPGLDPGDDGTIAGGTNVDMSNTDNRLVYATWSPASGWSLKGTVYANTAGASYTQMADVEALSGGRFVAVWIDKQGTADTLYYAVYDGAAWGVAVEVETSSQFLESPKVTVDAGDLATIVYRAHDGEAAEGEIYAGNLFERTVDLAAGRGAATIGVPNRLTSDGAVQLFHAVARGTGSGPLAAWMELDPAGAPQGGSGFSGGVNLGSSSSNGSTIGTGCSESTPDDDGDGLFDSLDLEVPLAIATAGDYLLRGDLYDLHGRFVARAEAGAAELAAGAQTLTLSFPGAVLSAHPVAGSTQLRHLTLLAGDPTPVVVDRLTVGCTISEYAAGDFAPARLRFDRAYYEPGMTAHLTIEDAAANAGAGAADTVEVKVHSSDDSDDITVVLTETGAATGVFEAQLGFSDTASDDDLDLILVSDGATVFARYDRQGSPEVWTANALYFEQYQEDGDGDGVPDATDNCPDVANSGQLDVDGDGIGNDCDPHPAEARGDANCDGAVNAADLAALGAHLTDGANVCDGADADHDLDVDGDDLPALVGLLFG